MAYTFKSAIEDYIGTFSDTTALDNWLTVAAKTILQMAPDNRLRKYALNVTVTVSGLDVTGYRVIYVHADNYESVEFASGYKSRLVDSGSIYYATATSPAHIYDNGKLYVFPSGGIAFAIQYPSIANDNDSTALTGYPKELVQAVILFAAIQGLNQNIDTHIATVDALTFNIQTPPSLVAPSFIYSNAVAATIGTATIGVFGTAPTYTPPTLSLTVVPSDLSITAIAPTTPSAPSFTYTDATAGTIASTAISALPTAPVYSAAFSSKPVFSLSLVGTAPTALVVPSFSYTDATVSLGVVDSLIDLSTQFTALGTDLDTDEDIELANAKINEIQTRIQQFNTQAQLTLQQAIENARLTTDVNKQNELETLSASVQQYASTVQRYASELEKYKVDINAKYQEYQLNLQAYINDTQAILTDATNTFNKNLAVYRATIEEDIEGARLTQQRLIEAATLTTDVDKQNQAETLAAMVQEYTAALSKFNEDIGLYGASVSSEVQEYTTNLRKWEIDRQTLLAQYSADIQSNWDAFQASNVEYQGTIQKAIEQARLDEARLNEQAQLTTNVDMQNKIKDLESQIAEYRANIESYQGGLNIYGNEIQEEAQRINSMISKLTAENQPMFDLLKSLKEEYAEIIKAFINGN